jgi:flagellar biosynthesis protein FliQ
MTARIAAAKWPLVLVGDTVVVALIVAVVIALFTAYATHRAAVR